MTAIRRRAVPRLLITLLASVALLAVACGDTDTDAGPAEDPQARSDAAAASAEASAASAEASAAGAAASAAEATAGESQASADAAAAAAAEAQATADAAQATADLAQATAEGSAADIAAAEAAVAAAQAALTEAQSASQQAQAALDAAQSEAAAARAEAAAAAADAQAAQEALQEALEEAMAAPPPPEPEPEATMAVPSDEIVISVTTEPSTLDAQVVNDRAARVVTGNISEALLFRDRGAQLTPGLAIDWRNVDETTWEFTLRPGVTFHDGSPFNGEAAAYSVNRMVAEDFETQRGSYIRGIAGAEAVDDTTIRVLTDGPNAILLLQMAQVPMVPAGAGDEMNEAPIGTGPYRFVEWNRGESIIAEINPDYWGDGGTIPRFTVRIIPDAQTALAALQNGEVHLVLDILPEQVDLVPQFKSVAATEFSYVAFNTFVPEMSSPDVRIAMNMGDRQGAAGRDHLRRVRPSEPGAAHGAGLDRLQPRRRALPVRPRRGACAAGRGRLRRRVRGDSEHPDRPVPACGGVGSTDRPATPRTSASMWHCACGSGTSTAAPDASPGPRKTRWT